MDVAFGCVVITDDDFLICWTSVILYADLSRISYDVPSEAISAEIWKG